MHFTHMARMLLLKSIHFWNNAFSLWNENKVLQLMPAGASLERFGEKDPVFIKWRFCRHCLKKQMDFKTKLYNFALKVKIKHVHLFLLTWHGSQQNVCNKWETKKICKCSNSSDLICTCWWTKNIFACTINISFLDSGHFDFTQIL